MPNVKKITLPVTKRGEESVCKILDATLMLLERDGIAQLTTNHIATESGVKVGSFYRFFDSKEAVIVALIERWFDSILTTTKRYLLQEAEKSGFSDLLQGLFMVNLQSEYVHSAAYKEVYQGASTMPVLERAFADHQQSIANLVARAYSDQDKSKAEVIEFCVFLHGMISSALDIVSLQKGKKRERQTGWVLQMIAGAVRKFEESPAL